MQPYTQTMQEDLANSNLKTSPVTESPPGLYSFFLGFQKDSSTELRNECRNLINKPWAFIKGF